MVSTRKWWFLKHNQNDFVVKEFHIISMRTLIALSFVRDVFTNGQTYPTPRSLAGRRRSRRFSNHSLLFCPLPPPPQCVIIALSFSNVCKISTFDPLKAFFVLSNGTLIAFGRFSVPQSAIGNSPFGLPKSASDGWEERRSLSGVFEETTTKGARSNKVCLWCSLVVVVRGKKGTRWSIHWWSSSSSSKSTLLRIAI